MSYIPVEECEHGYLYRIHSRNLRVGIYNKKVKGFIGIREKFDDKFLFTEYHADSGGQFGTVRPKEKLCKCPFFIDDDVEYKNDKEVFKWLEPYEEKYELIYKEELRKSGVKGI